MNLPVLIFPDVGKIEFEKMGRKIGLGKNLDIKSMLRAVRILLPIVQKQKDFCSELKAVIKGDKSFLILENLPTNKKEGNIYLISELFALCLIHASGYTPFSYREVKGCQLVHDIIPVLGKEKTRSSNGRISFPWHTDLSIMEKPFAPNILLLRGRVNEDKIPTIISPIDRAWDKIQEEHRINLLGQNYRHTSPDIMDDAFKGNKILSEYRPIVSNDSKGILRVSGNLFNVVSKDCNKKESVKELIKSLHDVEIPVTLSSSSAVLFDNSRVFHRRNQLSTGKRWLQRVYGTQNIDLIRNTLGFNKCRHIFDAYKLIFKGLM